MKYKITFKTTKETKTVTLECSSEMKAVGIAEDSLQNPNYEFVLDSIEKIEC